jgi:acyl carrier protein
MWTVWAQDVMATLTALTEQLVGSVLDPNTPLMQAGLDSIAAVELRNSVSQQFGVALPATVVFDYPTLQVPAPFLAVI